MKFLLVKLNHIGDTLLMTPTIRMLRERYSDAQIDVVVRRGTEGVLEGNPDISHIFAVARPERSKRRLAETLKEISFLFRSLFCTRYDFAFDLSNSDRAKVILLLSCAKRRALNRWHTRLGWKEKIFTHFSDYAWGKEHQVLKDFHTVTDVLGIQDEPGPLVLNTSQIDHQGLLERFGLKSKHYIVIHPTSRWSYKEWPDERWGVIFNAIRKRGYSILLTSGPDPRERDLVTRLSRQCAWSTSTNGSTTLIESAALIENARLYVGIDTVAMHMAAAVRTPVVALFGPTAEWSWSPWKVPYRLVLGNCPCKLSRNFTCTLSKPLPCMMDIEPKSVIDAIDTLLKEIN